MNKKAFILPFFALTWCAAASEFWPLDISSAAKWGFRDETAGDGKGGWTDQGPDVDLASLTVPEIEYGPAKFRILDEKTHPGATTMVLSRPIRGGSDEVLRVECPENQADGLYILHAAAWPPPDALGEIQVCYKDGSKEVIAVNTREHCRDWRGSGVNLSNGRIVWYGGGFESPVLFASAFPLKHSSPVWIGFRLTAPQAIWLIPAVTLKQGFKPFAPLTPVKMEAGENFVPVKYRWGTKKGSILDFSGLNDAPAGKYGFVKTSGENFSFENAPKKMIRFFGTNLVYHAVFPDRELAEKIADELAATGCNLARLHLNDELLIKKDAPTSLEIDPERLDRMEYLVAKLKERGIYISIDLYGCRRFRSGDGKELSADRAPFAMKYFYLLRSDAMENLKEFARRWLTHVNPHTGLAWNEEPALAFLNLVNEDPAEDAYSRGPQKGKLFEELFKERTGKVRTSSAEFTEFLYKLQQKRLQELLTFTRQKLKIQCPVTSLNMFDGPRLAWMREMFDFVDYHAYFDHPSYSRNYTFPWHFFQQSAITRMGYLPISAVPNRRYGKPFIMSEFLYCYPNQFRAEGGPLIGAYASLQNWACLLSYCWASMEGRNHVKELRGEFRTGCFSVCNDPLMVESNRIAALLFRRSDVQTAQNRYVAPFPETLSLAIPAVYTLESRLLGLVSQIGTEPTGKITQLPCDSPQAAAAVRKIKASGIAVSDTEELTLDSRNRRFLINTPRANSITLQDGSVRSGSLEVSHPDSFQTVAVFSMDGKPLTDSGRLLLFQLSDIVNSGDTFSDQSRTQLTAFGQLPLLLRRARCEITLHTAGSYRVYALSAAGVHKGELEGKIQNGAFRMKLDNSRFGGTTMYELVRKK